MRLNHYFYFDPALMGRLARIENALGLLLAWSEKMSAEMDRLIASVERNKVVSDSIVTLVEGLAQQIRDNVNDPVKLAALADEIDSSSDREAAAVVANTPAPVEEPTA